MPSILIKSTLLLVSLSLPLSETSASRSAAEEKGLSIAVEMDRRDSGWIDQQAGLNMVLRNRQGEESERALRVRSLEVDGDGDKSLTIFDHPADVKGTAFLSHTHARAPDDQWLYLPALKRVKRINSVNRSGPFMGSEFAYEDLTSQEIDKYHYKWVRDDVVDGHPAFVIERSPRYEHSGYTVQIVWVDQSIYQPRKVEFYDRKGALLKTLTLHDYRQYLARFWRASRMEMHNHQTGKSTTLTWNDYRFRTGLDAGDFNSTVLKRVR